MQEREKGEERRGEDRERGIKKRNAAQGEVSKI